MKIFRLILILPILVVALIGTWLAINLWPRPMEPPLWTEADLPIPEGVEGNGYPVLVEMRENPALQNLYEWPEALYDLDFYSFVEDRSDLTKHWALVTKLRPVLSDFLGQHAEALQAYRKLIEFPHFINQDSFKLDAKNAPWDLLLNLQKLEALDLLQETLKGNLSRVYDVWSKTFRMDQSWLFSARGYISHAVATAAVKRDLVQFSLLRGFLPTENREAILTTISDFDPEKVDYRRALISEYLFCLNAAESVVPEILQKKSLWLRLVFNRALFRKELNERFRRLELVLEGRAILPDEKGEDLGKGPFWWFYNPVGKIFIRVIFIDWTRITQDLVAEKEDLKAMRAKILAQGFSTESLQMPSPETMAAEPHPIR